MSSSVTENVKVFRVLQYDVKSVFESCCEQQRFTVFIFCKVGPNSQQQQQQQQQQQKKIAKN